MKDSDATTRFVVVEGSQSAHCCFDYTVVDTQRPVIIHGKQYIDSRSGLPQFESLCECMNREDADAIASALNLNEPCGLSAAEAPTSAEGVTHEQ